MVYIACKICQGETGGNETEGVTTESLRKILDTRRNTDYLSPRRVCIFSFGIL